MLEYTVRPISDRTGFDGVAHPTLFKSAWQSTLIILDRELRHLGADRVVLEVDVPESKIRVDGQLYANATASSTAVRIAFESRHGPMIYATDRFGYDRWGRPKAQGWQENVRAIALGLEALRKVDRYGITARGEQYRGFKAIEGGMSQLAALKVIHDAAGPMHAQEPLPKLIRWAKANAHPDRRGGDRALWDQVMEAARVLEEA
jgi:hypothetical protein